MHNNNDAKAIAIPWFFFFFSKTAELKVSNERGTNPVTMTFIDSQTGLVELMI